MDSYVCSGARLKCSCGDKDASLNISPARTVFLTGRPQANISDHAPLKNITPFGRCHTLKYPPTAAATAANRGHLTPMPCIPSTVTPWQNGEKGVKIVSAPALLKSSYCKCIWGGMIQITDDGQNPVTNQDLSRFLKKQL